MVDDGWAEKMESEFEFVALRQAVVVAELVFEIGKVAIEQVGRVRDLEGWVLQASEQPRQIAFEA